MPVAPHSSIGIANLPNQRHKIVSRKGVNFNIMVVGESGLGKTTYLNTLFNTLLRDYKNQEPKTRWGRQTRRTVSVEVTRLDVEEKGFPLRLSLIDTPGFGDYSNNTDCWVPICDYIDEQYLEYMRKEQQSVRANIDDTRVNALLYFIQPTGHTLKPLDVTVMKHLSTRCNLIPVIAKADTLTQNDIEIFKDNVRATLAEHKIETFTIDTKDEDEETTNRIVKILSAMPYSVIGSTTEVTTADGRKVRGRQYLWGVAEVENDAHCDFKLLRSLLLRTHMHDLLTSTQTHYENYRSSRLQSEGRTDDDPSVRARKQFEAKMAEDEVNLRKRFTEQVRVQESRFKEWEKRLLTERDRLNKDLETSHAVVKTLIQEVEELRQEMAKDGK